MSIAGGAHTASAQTVEYFSGLQIAPQKPNDQPTGQAPNPPSSQATNSYGAGTSSMYGQFQAQSESTAPPWILTEHIGVDEIATDNVEFPETGHRGDLISDFSGGGILTANSDRVYGELSLTGTYRQLIDNQEFDGFRAYGYANEAVTLLPGTLYLGLRGLMDDISREGLGLQNPLAEVSTLTQAYEISASPLYYTQFDGLTMNLLRYELGQVWFNRNLGAIKAPGLVLSQLSDSTDQIVRDDFRMDGTFDPRLLTDISLSGSIYSTVLPNPHDYINERGQIINAYALTRSLAVIGAIGAERLHDYNAPRIDGEDAIWSLGARYLPNADSYALLTYGRNDLKSDFAGELAWRITPLTSLYTDYTDSVITAQQLAISNNNVSELGPSGTFTHVAFAESPVLSTLDDPLLNSGPPGSGNQTAAIGLPLTELNNALPLENGLFRIKALRATLSTQILDNNFDLTYIKYDQTELAGHTPFTDTTQVAILSWHRFLSPDVLALIDVRVGNENGPESASLPSASTDRYGTTLDLDWEITEGLAGRLRYDFIYHDTHPSSVSADEEVLSVGLYKTFD
jgi:uncharacterized protein (PEP-CTERM system associated)